MRSLYVTGGRQRVGRPLTASATDWYEYQQGLILEVVPETGEVSRRVEYVSPPAACAEENPQILFKSGTVLDDRLYICTQTELLIYTLPEFRQAGYISLPCFNDLHHVRPTPAGTLLVANSGLDMVLELTPGGGVINEWSVLGEEPWSRFSRDDRLPQRRQHQAAHRAPEPYLYAWRRCLGHALSAAGCDLPDARRPAHRDRDRARPRWRAAPGPAVLHYGEWPYRDRQPRQPEGRGDRRSEHHARCRHAAGLVSRHSGRW